MNGERVPEFPSWVLMITHKSSAGHGRSGTTGKREVSPLLGKGGVAAPSSKWSRSFGGEAGVVRSTSDNRWLEPTTPSAPAKGLRGIFLMGAATPPCPRRGLRVSLQLFSMPRVQQKMWDMASLI